jgi:hypothetical protein
LSGTQARVDEWSASSDETKALSFVFPINVPITSVAKFLPAATAASSQSITLRWEEMLQGDGAANLVIYTNRVADGGQIAICEIGVSNDRRLLDLRPDRRHRTADPD